MTRSLPPDSLPPNSLPPGADDPPVPEPTSAAAPGDRFRGLLLAAAQAKNADPDSEPPEDDDRPIGVLLMDTMGGPRGLVDTTLPTIVFIVANAVGGLKPGIVAAIVCALLLVVERVVRRQSQQQAWSGLIGVGIAALIAYLLHSSSGFFLPGIAKNALYGVGCGLSLVFRRPLVGYVFAAFDRRYADWQTEPRLKRAAWWATSLWVAVFAVRVVVQGALYLADRPGWLAASSIAMGWPLFALALLGSVALARRAAPEVQSADESPAGTPPSSTAS